MDALVIGRIKKGAQNLGARALGELLATDERRKAVGKAVQKVQAGRRQLDDRAQQALTTLGLATQDDLQRVSRKIGRLRKRLGALSDKLS